jgi:hypothetical protein
LPCATAKSASTLNGRWQPSKQEGENYGDEEDNRTQDSAYGAQNCPQDRAHGAQNWPQDGAYGAQNGSQDGTHDPQGGTEGGSRCSQDRPESGSRCSQDRAEGGPRPQDDIGAQRIADCKAGWTNAESHELGSSRVNENRTCYVDILRTRRR